MKTLKQLTVLILFLSGLMTTGCDRKENAPPPEPPTINVTDSLVMVDLYHSMKLGEWGEAYNWDLPDQLGIDRGVIGKLPVHNPPPLYFCIRRLIQ